MNDVNSNVITVTFTTTAITQHRGALAHIMACYMADKYPEIKVTMIGFGNPRIGNKAFKDWSERKTNLAVWRYVYNYDTVTRIPAQIFGFHHAGHTFQIWQGDQSYVYFHHTGDGNYLGVPWFWYCK